MNRISSLVAFLFYISSTIFSAGAHAQVISTINGRIDSNSPSMPVVSISSPNCTSQGVTPVNYSSTPFRVSTSGNYSISLSYTPSPLNSLVSFYVYITSFDPTNGLVNCIAATNLTPTTLPAVPLTSGTQYFYVAFDDTFSQFTETTAVDFTATFDGPGRVLPPVSQVTAVPTLSEWSLTLLALIAATVGIRQIRRRI